MTHFLQRKLEIRRAFVEAEIPPKANKLPLYQTLGLSNTLLGHHGLACLYDNPWLWHE